jgi:hypothetical protein
MKPPSRQDLVSFNLFVPEVARRQIRTWAVMNRRPIQSIGLEMMDDWFSKLGSHAWSVRTRRTFPNTPTPAIQ